MSELIISYPTDADAAAELVNELEEADVPESDDRFRS
jgi:hypothetical protein